MFRPPFDGLALLVVLYYGWCFLVYPNSQIVRGNLPDPDDYMYLAQIMDWVKGQGWYDNIQHRLNPPDGITIHFSRLAQLPMAALMVFFQLLGLGPRAASMLMALIYPLLLLSGLLVALRWLAQSFVPKKWAGVSAYITLFATGMMFMFMPGHVDHHGLIVVIVAVTLGFAMRMTEKPAEPLWGFGAGLTMALGLTVALEILPWLLVIAGWIGLWATSKGGKAAINALAFGLALYLGSIVLLGITRPPGDWLTLDVLTYSAVYVLLTGGIAISLAGAAITSQALAAVRWIVSTSLAVLTGYLFLHRFPDLISGPYGGMDPELAEMILGEVDEAQPLLESHPSFLVLLLYLGGSFLAFGAGLRFFKQAKDNAARWRWSLLLAVLVAAFGLTVFYQYRFMGILGLSTIIPLTVLLQRGWTHIGTFKDGRKKTFAEIGLLLLVGPLTAVLYPALIDGRSFNRGIFLFPVDSSVVQTPCDTYQLERILNNPRLYGDHPRLIMNIMGQGPELLFRTNHRVLSAPFHTDVSGNVDAARFFSTPYASEAEAIARRRHIDLVVACRFVPKIFTRAPDHAPTTTAGADASATNEHDFSPHFIELLMMNKQPAWLKPVHSPALRNFVIFEMVPSPAQREREGPNHLLGK